MFAKIITCILAAGATACGLLVIRQHRIDAAHEMSDIHRRLLANEEQIGRVRVTIHQDLRQDRVVQMVKDYEANQGIVMVPLMLNNCFALINPRATELAPATESAAADKDPSQEGPASPDTSTSSTSKQSNRP